MSAAGSLQASQLQPYLVEAEALLAQSRQHEAEWLRQARHNALQVFYKQGYPNTRLEAWKYTRLNLDTKAFHLARPVQVYADALNHLPLLDLSPHRIVLMNGYVDKQLSRIDDLPAYVKVSSLCEEPELVKQTLQQQKPSDGLQALNLGVMQDGVVINIADGHELDVPLHIIHLTETDTPVASHNFNLISVGNNTRATIIESFHCLGGADYFSNSQSVIQLKQGAGLNHYRLQLDAQQAMHVSTREIQQGRDSHFSAFTLSLGGGTVRDALDVQMRGAGAECYLNGLFVANDRQHHDFHINVEHQAPQCLSREFYRGIAAGRGRGVFDGRVLVAAHAQGTDAAMSSKNLLLSAHAEIDVKPWLEIYADDVKCAHGATVGQIDAEALFYLRSRGVDEAEARSLLTFAFVNEVLDKISDVPIKKSLQAVVNTHLALQGAV